MKKMTFDFKKIMLTGFFFLLPVVVLLVILSKVLGFLEGVAAPIARILPFDSVIGLRTPMIVAFILILFFCYLAGFLVLNAGAGKVSHWLEDHLLSLIPGYTFMKSSGQIMTGMEENKEKQQVVIVKVDEYWQIGFLMGRLQDGRYSVYIPAAPQPWSGNVCIFTEDRVEVIDMEYKEALRYIKQLGTVTPKDTFTKPA